jgi:hypothetical protein
VLIRNKVAGFIVTGGQDNVQSVAGEMMMFFGELGFSFAQFPFVGHSRGWSAEDMENNMEAVKADEELREGTRALARRCLQRARDLVAAGGGRRADRARRPQGQCRLRQGAGTGLNGRPGAVRRAREPTAIGRMSISCQSRALPV